jgi:hypothetical protein
VEAYIHANFGIVFYCWFGITTLLAIFEAIMWNYVFKVEIAKLEGNRQGFHRVLMNRERAALIRGHHPKLWKVFLRVALFAAIWILSMIPIMFIFGT